MKFHVMTGPACMLLLGACVTYPAQTASNSDIMVAVVGDAAAVISEQIDYVDDDRIICKSTMITGSRFKKKLCMSWFEWKEVNQRGKEYTDDIQSDSTLVNNS